MIHITSHWESDLRIGREAFCQRNVHKPRLISLSVAAVVQIHALWCALSLPSRLRRCCHQSRPTAQLAADRAVEEPFPAPANLRANTQSPNRANVLRFLASHALGTCDFRPDVARFMQNRHCLNWAGSCLRRSTPAGLREYLDGRRDLKPRPAPGATVVSFSLSCRGLLLAGISFAGLGPSRASNSRSCGCSR